MESTKAIKLFENCLITIGNQRSIIIDTQRHAYHFIPNSLALLFDDSNVLDIGKITNADDKSILKEYIDFLLENELVFLCDNNIVNNFIKIDINNWDYPASITNAIIEVDQLNANQVFRIASVLTSTHLTRHIELYIPEKINYNFLNNFLMQIDEFDLYSYNLIIGLEDNNEFDMVVGLLTTKKKIQRSIIFSSDRNDIIATNNSGWGNIFTTNDAFSYSQCGVTDKFNLCINLSHITESQNHNTCLNRKIYIDICGNIKNCPNTKEIFGNIQTTELTTVLENNEFTKYWNIKKDQITVCRDCEFRHICTDCRAFLEDPDDVYSKPLKCGYNPYNCEWEEWDTNPVKEMAITKYGIL